MNVKIKKISKLSPSASKVILAQKDSNFDEFGFSEGEKKYITKKINDDSKLISLNYYDKWVFIQIIENEKPAYRIHEEARKAASSLHSKIAAEKIEKVQLLNIAEIRTALLPFAEGLALSNYQFLKYFGDAKDKANSLKNIDIFDKDIAKKDVDILQNILDGATHARDLVNEPLSYLTAPKLADEIRSLGKEAGFKVTVFNKKKIELEKMGGLLAVNRGSIDPPTFSILEWKPPKAKNKKPIVLVGKGVVYDTGGLSLKPTKGSMDEMKSDMAGAAAVIGTIYAAAKNELPVHVIGLVPATDNRPDGNAYAPGDVINMHSGMTVEVMNTDAEGRMLLADALSYAKKYEPELVIDLATLTGAAAVAIGSQGIVGMTNAEKDIFNKLTESGNNVYERIAEFPFWDEYSEMLKSDIADVKNIGGREAGAITAGKFLEKFTDYPYIHLDIAGPAFINKNDSYRSKGGTGVGVRLLNDFLKNF